MEIRAISIDKNKNKTHPNCLYNDKWQLNSIGPISFSHFSITRRTKRLLDLKGTRLSKTFAHIRK